VSDSFFEIESNDLLLKILITCDMKATECGPTHFPYAPNIFRCLTGSGVGIDALGIPGENMKYIRLKKQPVCILRNETSVDFLNNVLKVSYLGM
jgi:hypothetical protein